MRGLEPLPTNTPEEPKFVSRSASWAVSFGRIRCEGAAFVQGAQAKMLKGALAERPSGCSAAEDCRPVAGNDRPLWACFCPWPCEGKRQEQNRTVRKPQAAENFPAAGQRESLAFSRTDVCAEERQKALAGRLSAGLWTRGAALCRQACGFLGMGCTESLELFGARPVCRNVVLSVPGTNFCPDRLCLLRPCLLRPCPLPLPAIDGDRSGA